MIDLEAGTKNVTVQHPLPSDGDSVYVKDLDLLVSDNYNFTNEVSDYFCSLKSVNEDTTSNPVKQIKLWFKRTIYTNSIGFGCNDLTKNFSNIKIELLGSGEVVRQTIDESDDDTKYNSKVITFAPNALNGVIISFETTDPVGLSNIVIRKENLVRAQIEGQAPDGTTVPFQATPLGNFKVSVEEYGDTPSVDAFARLRVSDNFTVFDSKQLHDKQPLFWDERLGGSATSAHVPVDAATKMTVTANAADYAIRQTKQRFNYQPGKSQLVFMTYRAPQETGLTKRIGYFDGIGTNFLTPNNGIFFETDGDLSWNICKDGTITERITQANWNVDKLDGTGPSGITYDPEACHILIIDFEWLGVGRVRVGFVIDGLIHYVHYFNHANTASFDSVYMSTPNLPLRYSIETDGTAGSELDHICSTVISEGGLEKTGILRVGETDSPLTSLANGTTYAMVGIRLKDLYKDITIIPESLSAMCTTNDQFRWAVAINPTIAGTFTYNDLTNSAVQVAQGDNTNTVADEGLVIASGFASSLSRESDKPLNTALRIGSTIDGTRDQLVLLIQPLSPNLEAYGALNIRELL